MTTCSAQEPSPAQGTIRKVRLQILEKMRESAIFHSIGNNALPDPRAMCGIIELARQIIFFGHIGGQDLGANNVEQHLTKLAQDLFDVLSEQIARSLRHDCERLHQSCDDCQSEGQKQALRLIEKLPAIRALLEEDVCAAFDGDPAARDYDEIVLSYPGFVAITVHRVAHELNLQAVPLLPRLMSETAHSETGIDIHPGARIGRAFFIDHGTGVVIGETAIIGDHVKMYQSTTLGALSFPRDKSGAIIRGQKRHPTIEDHVTIYAGATILGGDTVVGRGSVIGGSVWLTHSVPPGTKVIMDAPRLRFKNSEHTVKDEVVDDFQI